MDETGLFWWVLPNKTLASVQERETHRVKSSKLELVLIGMYKKPRCFKDINTNALPVNYIAQTNAWMSSDIFKHWFHHAVVHSRIEAAPPAQMLALQGNFTS